jgi:hypothetical protein
MIFVLALLSSPYVAAALSCANVRCYSPSTCVELADGSPICMMTVAFGGNPENPIVDRGIDFSGLTDDANNDLPSCTSSAMCPTPTSCIQNGSGAGYCGVTLAFPPTGRSAQRKLLSDPDGEACAAAELGCLPGQTCLATMSEQSPGTIENMCAWMLGNYSEDYSGGQGYANSATIPPMSRVVYVCILASLLLASL